MWKYHENNETLENKYGDWMHSNTRWRLPNEEEDGTIEEIVTSNVLGLDNNSTRLGTKVLLERYDGSEYQKWARSKTTRNGYFTLKCPISGKYLTSLRPSSPPSISSNSLIIHSYDILVGFI